MQRFFTEDELDLIKFMIEENSELENNNDLDNSEESEVEEKLINNETIALFPKLVSPNLDEIKPEGNSKGKTTGLFTTFLTSTDPDEVNKLFITNKPINESDDILVIKESDSKDKIVLEFINSENLNSEINKRDITENYKIEINKSIDLKSKYSNMLQLVSKLNSSPNSLYENISDTRLKRNKINNVFLEVLKLFDIKIIESDNISDYIITKEWLLNSPLITESIQGKIIDQPRTNLKDRDFSIDIINQELRLLFTNGEITGNIGSLLELLERLRNHINDNGIDKVKARMIQIILNTYIRYHLGEEVYTLVIIPNTNIENSVLITYFRNQDENVIFDIQENNIIYTVHHSLDAYLKESIGEDLLSKVRIIRLSSIDFEAEEINIQKFNKGLPYEELLFRILENPDNVSRIGESVDLYNNLNEADSNESKLRSKITKKIIGVYDKLDKTGNNSRHIASILNNLNDKEFFDYIHKIVDNKENNFTLEVLPGKNEPSLKDVKEALEFLKVPETEYVYFRHNGNENDPLRTRHPVTVGYLHIKRLRVRRFVRKMIKHWGLQERFKFKSFNCYSI